jgi:hypothetical protein
MERALGAELMEHLGYEKGASAGRGKGNSRNATSSPFPADPVRIRTIHGCPGLLHFSNFADLYCGLRGTTGSMRISLTTPCW